MARPVSRAEFSRLAGVSGAAITKACKKQLAPACLSGGRIDADHPAARAYLESKGIAPTPTPAKAAKPARNAPAPRRKKATPAPAAPAEEPPQDAGAQLAYPIAGPGDIDAVADLTIREAVERWGSVTALKDWLDALKKIVDIREKDLKNFETEGRLIERELVKTHVFGAIEAGNRRLLTDAPKTIARRIYALAKSGATMEEAEQTVREIIGSQLKPVKATAVRVLKNA